MSKILSGDHAPLNVTQEANHRIFVGIGWNPNENFSVLQELKHLIKGKSIHHDIDVCCFMYDAEKSLIGCVSADPEQAASKDGKIYHSGDNTEGLGDGDDEQISVELNGLNENIHHLAFVAMIKSGHMFSDIADPEIRIADGISDFNFIHVDLKSAQNNAHPAFVFAHIYRQDKHWMLHNISKFTPLHDNFAEFVKPLLVIA